MQVFPDGLSDSGESRPLDMAYWSGAPKFRSGISATDRKDDDTQDAQNKHKHADPSEPTHSPTHPPSPSVAHHRCSPSKRISYTCGKDPD
jgi:hypothetical protein